MAVRKGEKAVKWLEGERGILYTIHRVVLTGSAWEQEEGVDRSSPSP